MHYDLIINGGGIIGASLALSLQSSGLELALVESRDLSGSTPAPSTQDWDSRVYAISPGSAALLAELGVWQNLPADRVTPVYDMAVWGDDAVTRLDFSAYDAGLAELAFIVENRALESVLWQALRVCAQIDIFSPAQPAAVSWQADSASLTLADGRVLKAALLVGAEGADSWLRQQADIKVKTRPYQQLGVVANFICEKNHAHCARQWFRQDGVLALLPLPGQRVSMVWSLQENAARALLALPAEAFCGRVMDAAHHSLGALQLQNRPAAFPLNLVRVERLVAPRLALIGDAAHGIHPLAGQGVNLGLRDVRELAQILTAAGSAADCGDSLWLRRYERARKEDIFALQSATDGLQRLFNNDNPLLSAIRNAGLGLTNRLPQIKNFLMQQALG